MFSFVVMKSDAAEWQWQNPLPQGDTLNDVWGSSATGFYAVGEGGTVLFYNGSSYSEMDTGVANTLSSIWADSLSNVYSVGDSGTVINYNGTSWQSIDPGMGNRPLKGVWVAGTGEIFIAATVGFYGMYNGSDWTSGNVNAVNASSQNMLDIWGASASEVFVVGGNGEIHFYNGTDWTAMDSRFTGNNLNGVWGTSANAVFAVGGGGRIVFYNGTSWDAMTSGVTISLRAVWGTSASNVYAIGDKPGATGGKILHYDGNVSGTWTTVYSNVENDLYGIYTDSSEVITVGATGLIMNGSGATWDTLSDYVTFENLYGLWNAPSGDLFAVGDSGTILTYNGTLWNSMSSGTTEPLRAVWGETSQNIFAVGGSTGTSTILNYNGTSWEAMTPAESNRDLKGVWGSSGSDVFAVGNNGHIAHYNGTSWDTMPSGLSGFIYDVWGTSPNEVFAVAWGGNILFYNGTSWDSMTSPTGRQLLSVWGKSNSDVYVVGDLAFDGNSLMYNGTSWDEVDMGTGNTILSLYDIWGAPDGKVYASGTGGAVVVYDGASWSVLSTPTTKTLWGIDSGATVVGDGGLILYRELLSPIVNSVTPADGATGVSVNTSVSATFNENIAEASVDNATFNLTLLSVPVAATLSTTGATVTLTPDSPLSSGTTYLATLAAGIEDLSDNSTLADYTWSFTTESQPDDGGDSGSSGGGGGGCFIATAAYGSYSESHVMALREFRDDVLLKSKAGAVLVEMYYIYSPSVADLIATHPALRASVRLALAPVVGTVQHPGVALMLMGFVLAGAAEAVRRRRRRKL
jgi:hypothetical protein